MVGAALGCAACGETRRAPAASEGKVAAASIRTSGEEFRGQDAGGHHLVSAPVVFIERTTSGDSFLVLLRMNRRLPVNRLDRGSDANFIVDGHGLDATPESFGRPGRDCYRGFVGNDSGTDDHEAGQVVPFEMTVGDRKRTIRGNVALFEGGAAYEAAVRRLRCSVVDRPLPGAAR